MDQEIPENYRKHFKRFGKALDPRSDVKNTIEDMAKAWGKILGKDQLSAYVDALQGKNYTVKDIKQACDSIKYKSRFFPSIADLCTELEGIRPLDVRREQTFQDCERCANTGARFKKHKDDIEYLYRCNCDWGRTNFPSYVPFY